MRVFSVRRVTASLCSGTLDDASGARLGPPHTAESPPRDTKMRETWHLRPWGKDAHLQRATQQEGARGSLWASAGNRRRQRCRTGVGATRGAPEC